MGRCNQAVLGRAGARPPPGDREPTAPEQQAAPDARPVCLAAGLNTGSMLFRNSAWTRTLLAEMCAHAHREDLDAMRAVRH